MVVTPALCILAACALRAPHRQGSESSDSMGTAG
jgi:hypothetical protein